MRAIRDLLIILTLVIVGFILFGRLPVVWNYNGTEHIFYMPRNLSPEHKAIFYKMNPELKKKEEQK